MHIFSLGSGIHSSREGMETGKGALKWATEPQEGEKGDSIWLGKEEATGWSKREYSKGAR